MRRDKDPGSSPSVVGPWVYSVEPLLLGLPGMLLGLGLGLGFEVGLVVS